MKVFIKESIPYIIIFIVVVLIRTYIITPVTVIGSSMYPNLKNDELLLLSKISYKLHDIERFDIVVINDSEEEKIIKRVIGLPGENVYYKNNKLVIDNNVIEDIYANGNTSDFNLYEICKINNLSCSDGIPSGYYLVLGDNREISKDSRYIGLINENQIMGRAVVRFWPLNKIKLLTK